MSRHRTVETRGTVVLMALCFVTVLGIGLAYFLSLSVQSMKFSNRSYVDSVSKMQSEMGLELALAAIYSNDWSAWTISGSTATRRVTFTNTKYGSSRLTSAIDLRIDNYKAYNTDATWSSSGNYLTNNLVGRSGVWYRCISPNSNSNRDPQYLTSAGSNSTSIYWAEEQATLSWQWDAGITYQPGTLIFDKGNWFVCLYSNSLEPPGGNWKQITGFTTSYPFPPTPDAAMLDYWNGANWTWYYYSYYGGYYNNSTPFAPYVWPTISWQWGSGISYIVGDKVHSNGTWYVCSTAHTSTNLLKPPNSNWTTNANTATNASLWAYSSSMSYKQGDVAYSGSSWYRCIQACTGQTPPNTTYWSNAPLLPVNWDPGRQYAANDIVFYNEIWYRCLSAHSKQTPPSGTSSNSYWYTTRDASYKWNSATAYAAGTYVSYDGIWYRSKSANSGRSPINATYWTAQVSPVLYVQSTLTLPDNSQPLVTQVRATLAKAPLFPNAVAASSTLSITNGGTVDSYNSSQGTYASQTPGYSAVLAGGNKSGTAVTMVGTLVKGYVSAPPAADSPFAPLWSYDAGANLIGPSSSVTMDLTRVSPSPSIPQFDITDVTNNNNSFTLSVGTDSTIGQAGATTPQVFTIHSDLIRTSSDKLTINGPVILNVMGGITIGSGSIVIRSTGSAEIHFSGALNIQSGGGIDNQTLDPKKLILIGTANSGSHNFSSATPYYGTIYMPKASLSVDTGVVIYGALSAQNITFSAEATVHYDISLRAATFGGVVTPFIIPEWRELTTSTDKVAF